MNGYVLEVNRTQLDQHRVVETEIPTPAQEAGQVVLRVEKFALTANNITYGVAGDRIGYWNFFPAEDNWGRIPCWGIAEVANSDINGIIPGDRYYGYFPMATELLVSPTKVSQHGFIDSSPHRQELSVMYNFYSKVTPDNGFRSGFDDHQILYRPLFSTAFVLDLYLAERQFAQADQVALSSASSKTALGLAHQLKTNRDIPVVGLTSDTNVEFVKSLDLYDEVVTYAKIPQMKSTKLTTFVDMAGDQGVINLLHETFGKNLVMHCGVGRTHWEDTTDPSTRSGAERVGFFAPTEIQRFQQSMGMDQYQESFQQAWNQFAEAMDNWLSITYLDGKAGLIEGYQTILHGAKPSQALVVRP